MGAGKADIDTSPVAMNRMRAICFCVINAGYWHVSCMPVIHFLFSFDI